MQWSDLWSIIKEINLYKFRLTIAKLVIQIIFVLNVKINIISELMQINVYKIVEIII